MTKPTKFSREDELGFCFAIESGLEEDQVWHATVLPLLEGLSENDIDTAGGDQSGQGDAKAHFAGDQLNHIHGMNQGETADCGSR